MHAANTETCLPELPEVRDWVSVRARAGGMVGVMVMGEVRVRVRVGVRVRVRITVRGQGQVPG